MSKLGPGFSHGYRGTVTWAILCYFPGTLFPNRIRSRVAGIQTGAHTGCQHCRWSYIRLQAPRIVLGRPCFWKISWRFIFNFFINFHFSRKAERHRNIDRSSIHCFTAPIACTSEVWARSKPGARNCSWASCMGGRDPSTWDTAHYPPGCTSTRGWVESRGSGTQMSHVSMGCRYPKWWHNCCAKSLL